jgi:hypothetical protein
VNVTLAISSLPSDEADYFFDPFVTPTTTEEIVYRLAGLLGFFSLVDCYVQLQQKLGYLTAKRADGMKPLEIRPQALQLLKNI